MRTKYFAHDQSKEKCNKKNIKKHMYTRHKYTSMYAPMVFENTGSNLFQSCLQVKQAELQGAFVP